MELLPLLQGLSTPVLLALCGLILYGNGRLHKLDKRITIIEFELREHRKTEPDDGDT